MTDNIYPQALYLANAIQNAKTAYLVNIHHKARRISLTEYTADWLAINGAQAPDGVDLHETLDKLMRAYQRVPQDEPPKNQILEAQTLGEDLAGMGVTMPKPVSLRANLNFKLIDDIAIVVKYLYACPEHCIITRSDHDTITKLYVNQDGRFMAKVLKGRVMGILTPDVPDFRCDSGLDLTTWPKIIQDLKSGPADNQSLFCNRFDEIKFALEVISVQAM